MPVMDEFQAERNRILKEGTFKEKASYLFYYYKWHVVATVLIGWMVISLIVTVVTHKNPGFYAAIINGTALVSLDTLETELGELMEIDPDKEEVILEADMYMNLKALDDNTNATTQKIAVYSSAGDIDVIHCDEEAIDYYAYNNVLVDLREVLTPAQLEKYEDKLLYADRHTIEETQKASEENNYQYKLIYPDDPRDPDSMVDPIPIAVDLTGASIMDQYYHFRTQNIFAAFRTGKRIDKIDRYFDYITK